MKNVNVLLTAFRGTSAALLVERKHDYKTIILPNDKVKDCEILIDVISNNKFDYVICFGQRPNIKNKVHIETTARDGEFYINTNFEFDKLKCLLEQNDIISKISHNAGTSFCNELYLNGLKYILQNDMETKLVFVHIPFMKNITDFDIFCEKILSACKVEL